MECRPSKSNFQYDNCRPWSCKKFRWINFRDPVCQRSLLHCQSTHLFFQYSCLLARLDHFRIWKMSRITLVVEDPFQDTFHLPNSPRNTDTLLEYLCRKGWKFLSWLCCQVGVRFLNYRQSRRWCSWLDSTCTNTQRVLDRRAVHNLWSHSRFPQFSHEG